MKYLYQAGIIFLFVFLGEMLARFIPFPVPAAIWGMLLLFAALCLKVIRMEQIRECGTFLTALLPVLFVAPTVNLMDQAEALAGSLPAVIAIVIISTFVTFLAAGRMTQALRTGKREEGKND